VVPAGTVLYVIYLQYLLLLHHHASSIMLPRAKKETKYTKRQKKWQEQNKQAENHLHHPNLV
jgi:hypothetical protein